MLSVIMLSLIILNVVMLNIVAPYQTLKLQQKRLKQCSLSNRLISMASLQIIIIIFLLSSSVGSPLLSKTLI
jgi:hypothetical protein